MAGQPCANRASKSGLSERRFNHERFSGTAARQYDHGPTDLLPDFREFLQNLGVSSEGSRQLHLNFCLPGVVSSRDLDRLILSLSPLSDSNRRTPLYKTENPSIFRAGVSLHPGIYGLFGPIVITANPLGLKRLWAKTGTCRLTAFLELRPNSGLRRRPVRSRYLRTLRHEHEPARLVPG